MKAVGHYCKDKWVLMYVQRWLSAGVLQEEGNYVDRVSGTPQGGVISPLLANIYLHVSFDKWMERHHRSKPFERYADDIVVHCKSERQAHYLMEEIRQRLSDCKLQMHEGKTKIVNIRGSSTRRYPRSYDFLGFTIEPHYTKVKSGERRVLPRSVISKKSIRSVLDKFKRLHKQRVSVEELAKEINPVIRGVINYYCKFWTAHTYTLWNQLNKRLQKWVRWQKGLYIFASIRWLQKKYRYSPDLFAHWKLVRP